MMLRRDCEGAGTQASATERLSHNYVRVNHTIYALSLVVKKV